VLLWGVRSGTMVPRMEGEERRERHQGMEWKWAMVSGMGWLCDEEGLGEDMVDDLLVFVYGVNGSMEMSSGSGWAWEVQW